jgi:hypothetical protein
VRVSGRQRAGVECAARVCVSSKQREQTKMGSVCCGIWDFGNWNPGIALDFGTRAESNRICGEEEREGRRPIRQTTSKRSALEKSFTFRNPYLQTPCSLVLSHISLISNQSPATSQQYSSLRTNQHQPHQPTEQAETLSEFQSPTAKPDIKQSKMH